MIKDNRGLTLVEVLSVIALISMVLILASSVHLFSQKQLTKQTSELENQLNIRLAISTISKELRGTTSVIAGAQKIYESLYAEDANLFLRGGSGFQGHIVTGGKNVTFAGGANAISQLIYAPNATFVVSDGAIIKGSIVAQSLTAHGGSRINFTQINNPELPFFPGNGGGTATLEDMIITNPIRESK